LAVEKQQCAQGDVLCGSGDIAVGCQVREILADFINSHLARVTLLVVEDEAADGLHVSLFCANAIMPDAELRGLGQAEEI